MENALEKIYYFVLGKGLYRSRLDGNYVQKIECENCSGVYFGDSRYMFARFSAQQGQYRYIEKSEQGQWKWQGGD